MEYFSRSEFACKCGCGFNTVDYELARVLDELRENFSSPVNVTSGCRCISHNHAIGGASKSQHLYGRATDIQVSGIDPEEVYEYLTEKYEYKYGLGLYDNFVHIDTRCTKVRWSK